MFIVIYMDAPPSGGDPSAASEALPSEVSAVVNRWGLRVVSTLIVDEPERELQSTLDVSDASTADHVVAELRALASVHAAYVKPADELP